MIHTLNTVSETGATPRSGVINRAMTAMAVATTLALSPVTAEGREPAGAKIENLQQANAISTDLANTYTRCHADGTVLAVKSLRAACADFKRVTIFGSTHGEGENPVDAGGNTVDWRAIAKWLGLEGWLNEHIAQQTKIIQKQSHTSGNNSTQFQAPRCMVDDQPMANLSARPVAPNQSQFLYFYMPQGGTLSAAARYYNTSVANLQYWNRIQNPDQVEAGRALWVMPNVR